MGTLIGQNILANFKLASENEKTAVFTQRAFEKSLPMPFQYGGDIAANVILAAAARLPAISNQKLMSINVECVSPGDYGQVRSYHVTRVRESNRFTHTLVKIKQSDAVVAIGNVAFHGHEHSSHSLHYMPSFPEDCSSPDRLEFDRDLLQKYESDPNVDSKSLNYARRTVLMLHGMGQEGKPCDPKVYFRLNKEPTTRLAFWMKFQDGEMKKVFPDIQNSLWSAALLAYASDYRIMGSALRQNPAFRDGKMTTLSHAMWFSPDPHCQLKSPSDWFLYDTRLMMSGNNTVLCEGHMWSEQKQLLAITKQQGLCRPKL